MPFAIGGNQLDTGYEVSNSARMNSSETFTKTISSTTSRNTFTISTWLKRSSTSGNGGIFGVGTASSDTGRFFLRFTSSDKLAATGGATNFRISNAVFRDVSAFYHIVCVFDSTNATAQNRLRLYVNGVEITSWSTNNTVNSSQNTPVNESGKTHVVGGDGDNSSAKFSGYLAEFNFIDGQAKAPTDFGEFDDNGVWIPKKYNGTYTNNSFFLEFQNSGSLGNDTSGLGNNYTANNFNTVDQTTDTPTNNFATINAVSNYYASAILSEGNTKLVTDGAAYTYSVSSIGVSAGKWYMEDKIGAGINNWFGVGIAEGESSNASGVLGRDTYFPAGNEYGQIGWFGYGTDFVYQNDGYYSGSTSDYDTDGYTTNDILGIALDADNNNVKFYKNGTVQNSGNAFTLGSSSTGFWHFAFGDYDGQNAHFHTHNLNFGNPAFSISSGNSDANGYGNFEYAVPSGYYALCTKNLAEFG